MAFRKLKMPDYNYPPKATVKIRNAAGSDFFDPGEAVPLRKLIKMVVVALMSLDNEDGSTIPEMKRLLCSEKLLNPTVDLRPAVICALKKERIKRPPSAVEAGVYGKYVVASDHPEVSLSILKARLLSQSEKRSRGKKKS